ncbi:MAG: ferrous iron transport protein B [Planctomycetes bacterium]|nr:ferrous iron transport protein B [Planctomycetota bacterium]
MTSSGRHNRADRHVVALIGNPNVGKSTLFTALTGTRQKVANFPGVTVEAKLGTTNFENTEFTVIDLPGTYSLAARSPDERVAIDALLGRLPQTPAPDGVILILDASSLDRNLYLGTQVLEYGLPTVIALTMVDVAKDRGISIDLEKLSAALGVSVVVVNAPSNLGVAELKATLHRQLHHPGKPLELPFPPGLRQAADDLYQDLCDLSVDLGYKPSRPEAMRLLVDTAGPMQQEVREAGGAAFVEKLEQLRNRAAQGRSLALQEAQARYGQISAWMREAKQTQASDARTRTDKVDAILTHKLWGTLVFVLVMGLMFQSIYSWSGPLMEGIEGGIGWLGEQVVSLLPQDAAMLRSLVGSGIFGGVGGVLVFLPQILILFLFIAVLEDLGYMSRAAFLMDRIMSRFGLSGRSFIPLLSSFACAIPGIMGTRVIEDRNTRLTTVFLAPFMSCSARLPVYTLMIGAFVPGQTVLGFLNLQGLVLFAMYWVGPAFAVPTALVLKRGILKSKVTPFLMEMPSYKMPRLKNVLRVLYERGSSFVKRAGTVILAVSIIVWALLWFPHSSQVSQPFENQRQAATEQYEAESNRLANGYKPGLAGADLAAQPDVEAALQDVAELQETRAQGQQEDQAAFGHDPQALAEAARLDEAAYVATLQELKRRHKQAFDAAMGLNEAQAKRDEVIADADHGESAALAEDSILGRVGHALAPAFRPLGWDWRIGMGAIASFPAREVIVGTLGTIFSLGSEVEAEDASLRDHLVAAKDEDGNPLFTLATALSVMVFFALCAQCAATLAVMRRETNSWKWPIASFLYMTTLAYVVAAATFWVARGLGG